MRLTLLLIKSAGRNKVIEGRLKDELRLVGQRLPAIPARGPERAGGIHEALEQERHILIGGRFQRNLIQLVRARIIEGLEIGHTATEAINALQISLHICAPLAGGPRSAGHLDTGRGLYRKADGAVRLRRIQIVALGIGCDAHVIDLVKVIKSGACQGLLFGGRHLLLLLILIPSGPA